MREVELLAPAGDMEKLKTAIEYGADAVFLGGEEFGLRTAAKNFTNADLKNAVEYAHERGKKVFVTMNIIAHNSDFDNIDDYIIYLDSINVDGIIVADPGIFMKIKNLAPRIELHISTQANITNLETALFWYSLGAKRIVLARELSIDEIKHIKQNIPKDLEIEVFVHGAMCISYSGRCLLSNYMTGRDANHGDCAQSCRWKYKLVEENRPDKSYPIEENERGTFIFNSKDLCLIEYVDELIEAGIDSFKIEGRVKTQYYVATVIRAYRLAIDAVKNGKYNDEYKKFLLDEIRKASHRDFTTGFIFGKPGADAQNYESSAYLRGYDFIAQIIEYDKETKIATLEQRNKFILGDEVEIFGPIEKIYYYKITEMKNEMGESVESAPRAKETITMRIDADLKPGYMIRRKVSENS
ncbi:MAG: U32 family peptidase [Tissierellia bacterium]|nr:U32 family peptidase [Tissierellia bacterium]